MPDKINNNQATANSRKPDTWDDFFSVLKDTDAPADFLNEKERNQEKQDRDPFAEWTYPELDSANLRPYFAVNALFHAASHPSVSR